MLTGTKARAPRLPAVLALGLAALAGGPPRAGRAAEPAGEDDALRLVVVVVVDQLRGDVVHRLGGVLGPDGLRRLAEGGVWYRNAHYSHANTVTGPGHATIATGARPSGHGIASNDWYDRRSGAKINCVSDSSSPVVGTAGETGNASPVNLTSTTFSDEWILATGGRGRAIGISGKDRGAILPVGKMGKAFWFTTSTGRMVSSTFYYKELPAWAAAFSRGKPAEKHWKKSWERATRDDDGVPVAADDRPFEKDIHGFKRTFPHPFGKDHDKIDNRLYEQVQASIYGDELVMDFALEALRAEELGKRGGLDVLAISLSSNDSVGHNFGPDSVEAKEVTHGLDRQLARLLAHLDREIGPRRYLLVLSADHGVAFPTETTSSRGYATARYDTAEILKRINRRLNFTIRYLDWSLGFAGPGYFFDPDALRFGGKPAEELEGIVAEVIRETTGISAVFRRSDILAGRLPESEVARKVRNTFHSTRSPDVYLVSNAYWLEGSTPASHGTPYAYDTHVPVIFFGAGLEPQEVLRQVDVMDIAPTFSAILRTAFPSASVGTPLPEVLNGVKARALPFWRKQGF